MPSACASRHVPRIRLVTNNENRDEDIHGCEESASYNMQISRFSEFLTAARVVAITQDTFASCNLSVESCVAEIHRRKL